jgi:hypothetical protein
MSKLSWIAAAALALAGCTTEVDVETGAGQAALQPLPCNEGQVLICHVPPGNPGNMHEVCVGLAAVTAHLEEHDDTVPGPCAGVCGDLETSCTSGDDCCAPYLCLAGVCVSQT